MPDLAVDLDGLESTVSSLHHVQSGLDGTRNVINGAAADLGDASVWSALDAFENHWDDGRDQIRKNLEGTAKLLGDAVQSYRKADQDLSDGLTKHETQTTNHTAR